MRTMLVGICVAAALPAAIWLERGDAGSLISSAQSAGGEGPLETIFGTLSAEDPAESVFDVDLYKIWIPDPLNFRASTTDAPGIYVSDPQLFLFDSGGFGVYMNDDDESGMSGSQSRLPDGHPFGPVNRGVYYLGIGWFDNEPFSAGGAIFSGANATGTNGPGAGGGDPLAGWDGNVVGRLDLETGYAIALNGAHAIPEPSALWLLSGGLAAILGLRRRT